MWLFAAFLIPAAAIFPLQSIFGMGADETAWRVAFLAVVFVVTSLTVSFTRGTLWRVVSFASLVLLALTAYELPRLFPRSLAKIGVEFIPPLDEQSMLDMPVTWPRASITQSADDLKARDAL